MKDAINHQAIKPRYLGGFATLFWGFQNELIWFAIPMAITLEARFFLNRRWALNRTDFYRVADLTSVGLVLMVLFLFLNRREYHFISTLLMWMPILWFPLVTVLAYSTTQRMSLDVLFYSLRRQREPVQQSWDMDYVFLGMCLLSAGLNREGSYYFPIVSAIVLAALYQLRSPRFSKTVLLLSMSLVFLSATGVHYGMRGTHLAIKHQTEQWIANWIRQRTDPMKTRTALGQVGRLKLSDSIALRIAPASGKPDFPPLLREAAYNSPSTIDWEVFDANFRTVEHADDYRWTFLNEPRSLFREARIYLEFDRQTALIPVPGELAEINELAAKEVNKSLYGTIQGTGLIPAPYYKVRYSNTGSLGEEPSSTDLIIPGEYRETLDKITPDDLTPEQALSFTQQFFSDFRYTLYQDSPEIADNPLDYFLNTSRAGHCEYFASATAMMLRQMGVPSRYVVGFAIQEWNDSLQMHVVRQRHAHAWVTAWVGGRWIVVDTTPSQWLALEENQSGLLQPLWDLLGNNQFRFQVWWSDQRIEDYERELYAIGGILVLILIWRIATSEQVILSEDKPGQNRHHRVLGQESPFFRIEEYLSGQGYRRGQGELMTRWLLRIGRPELLPMLSRHNRWRFDPGGISIEERQKLDAQVSEWLDLNAQSPEKTGNA